MPHSDCSKTSSSGGGSSFLVHEPFSQLPTSVPNFSSLSDLPALYNFLIQRYPSSTSTVLCLHPHSPSRTQCFLKTSIHSFPSLQPHLMNSSSTATLTSIWIILLTISHLSFCPFYLLLTSLSTSAFLPMTKNTFSIWSQPTPHLLRLFLSPIGLHRITFLFSPNCL